MNIAHANPPTGLPAHLSRPPSECRTLRPLSSLIQLYPRPSVHPFHLRRASRQSPTSLLSVLPENTSNSTQADCSSDRSNQLIVNDRLSMPSFAHCCLLGMRARVRSRRRTLECSCGCSYMSLGGIEVKCLPLMCDGAFRVHTTLSALLSSVVGSVVTREQCSSTH